MKNIQVLPTDKPSSICKDEMVNNRHQELFDYLVNELNTIASQTQMFEVERIVLNIQDKSTYSNQETLEEAARNYRDLKLPDDLYDGFIAGAKWQAKRMHTEEDLKKAFKSCYTPFSFDRIGDLEQDFNKWFETFKKK
jgi:hypothetical protein